MENAVDSPKKNFLPILVLLLLLIVLPVALIVSKQRQAPKKAAGDEPTNRCFLCHTGYPSCQGAFDEDYWTVLEDVGSPQLAAVRTQAGETSNPVFIKWVCPEDYKATQGRIFKPELILTPIPEIPSLLCGFVNDKTGPESDESKKTRSWYDTNGRTEGYVRCDNIYHIAQKGVGTDVIKELEVSFNNVAQ